MYKATLNNSTQSKGNKDTMNVSLSSLEALETAELSLFKAFSGSKANQLEVV
jgi:hypothetical protein